MNEEMTEKIRRILADKPEMTYITEADQKTYRENDVRGFSLKSASGEAVQFWASFRDYQEWTIGIKDGGIEKIPSWVEEGSEIVEIQHWQN